MEDGSEISMDEQDKWADLGVKKGLHGEDTHTRVA